MRRSAFISTALHIAILLWAVASWPQTKMDPPVLLEIPVDRCWRAPQRGRDGDLIDEGGVLRPHPGGGPFNTAVGLQALQNTTANANVGVGDLALLNNTSGFFNTAIGAAAGELLTTGHNNICIGQGSFGVAGESNTVRIGDGLPTGAGMSQCFIGGILSHNVTPGLGDSIVTINTTTGQLGWTFDSAANKVAEQQKKIEEQQASINQLKIEIQTMVAQLNEQAAQIQKVSAQMEVNKPAPQVVVNKP
jgi:hypothetical protein